MAKMLNVGLKPELITDPAYPATAFPRVDAATVRTGIEATRVAVADLGLELESCLVDLGETAEAQLRSVLADQHYEVIMIGAGVRLEPGLTPLLEALINCVMEMAPTSRVCFNEGPESSVEAVQRWWPPQRL